MDYFGINMTEGQLAPIQSLALAHIGDAVFEIMVRTRLLSEGALTASTLHRRTVERVSAKAQARYAEKMLPALTEREMTVYKRGRNAKVTNMPRPSSEGEYHSATGLEALFGWLYLRGEKERLNRLFDIMMEDTNAD